MPETIFSVGSETHRIELEGMTGFLVKDAEGWHIAANIGELTHPSGQLFSSKDEAERHLRYIVRERKLEAIRAQLKSWNNRADGLDARVRMYLDNVLTYVWREKGNAIDYDDGAAMRVWVDYLKDPERHQTAQLAKMSLYRPLIDVAKPRARGRSSKISPRSGEKEERLLEERKMISQRITALKMQENELSN